MKLNLIKAFTLALGVLAVGIYAGCKPDTFGLGNGLTPKSLTASFTVTPVTGKSNYYVVKANNNSVIAVKWDHGDGSGNNIGKTTDTLFYPDAGIYTVTLTAIGAGGVSQTATQTVTVPLSDPTSGNLVVGGKMLTGDDAKWTHVTINAGVTMVMDPVKNVMVASGGNYGHAAVYQAVNLTAGQKYMVDMTISGSGATDTWFETYVGTAVPANGSDYSSGGIKIALNTWSGCGKTAFNGLLSKISCNGAGKTFTPTVTGTYYLFIKSGGSNLGTTGISFTNVQLRGTK
jgi:PKD repeat protein